MTDRAYPLPPLSGTPGNVLKEGASPGTVEWGPSGGGGGTKFSAVEVVNAVRDLALADYGKLLVFSGINGTALRIRKATNYGVGFWFAVVSNEDANVPTVIHGDAGGGNFYTSSGNSDAIAPNAVVANKAGAYVEVICFRSTGAGPYVQDFCLSSNGSWDQT